MSGQAYTSHDQESEECSLGLQVKSKLQKMSDDALLDCPACNQSALNKLLSAGGFRLSGSGWYETDFKSGDKKNISGEQKTADSKTASAE